MSAVGIPAPGTRGRRVADGVLRWVVAIGGALVVFGVVIWAKGVNPIEAYQQMLSALLAVDSVSSVLLKATPIILAALAVAVPARAGLTNVGGEGQLVLGGVAAAGVVNVLGGATPMAVLLPAMLVAAAAAGALWAGFAGLLRESLRINEAVTTLLMNYLAIDLMSFLIYDAWKDPNGSGQPASVELPLNARLPLIGTSKLHMGFVIALVATGLVWAVLKYTTWGFRLRVVGGNPEAARRAGYRVGGLIIGAMLVGGALAGIGGFTQLAGAEFKLRSGFLLQYGYIAFLASWLARHKPVRVAIASIVLAALTIAGDSLQIDSGLPAASVNILMALVLLAVFGWTGGGRQGLFIKRGAA
jgi:general nucleoside transport system permease protein